MLTILHTADWHLGQSFFGYERDSEHAAFIDWLVQYIKNVQPSALLLAGDVFDTINPSARATEHFFGFLAKARAAAVNMQFVIVAGNHDAGARLEAPNGLLNAFDIHVIGTVHRDSNGQIDLERFIVPLKDSHGDVQALVLAIPFLRPSDVPVVQQQSDPYLDGIRQIYQEATQLACQKRDTQFPGATILGIGHLHLLGGDESKDSERRLVIGGVEALNADAFPSQLDYVALGHLHKAQQFRGGTIRYSGSPIPLSFAEMHYQHQILQLKVAKEQPLEIVSVPVPRSTQLLCIPEKGSAPIEVILQQIADLNFEGAINDNHQPFLEVRILQDRPDPSRRKKIEQAIEGKPLRLASIKVEYPQKNSSDSSETDSVNLQDLRSLDPEQVFLASYVEKYQSEPDVAVLAAFREILQETARES